MTMMSILAGNAFPISTGGPPVNTVAPALSGYSTVGYTLTTTNEIGRAHV